MQALKSSRELALQKPKDTTSQLTDPDKETDPRKETEPNKEPEPNMEHEPRKDKLDIRIDELDKKYPVQPNASLVKEFIDYHLTVKHGDEDAHQAAFEYSEYCALQFWKLKILNRTATEKELERYSKSICKEPLFSVISSIIAELRPDR